MPLIYYELVQLNFKISESVVKNFRQKQTDIQSLIVILAKK